MTFFFPLLSTQKLLPSYKPNLSKDNISQKSQFSYSKGIISHIFQKSSLFSVQLGKADRYLCVLKNHSSSNLLCNGPSMPHLDGKREKYGGGWQWPIIDEGWLQIVTMGLSVPHIHRPFLNIEKTKYNYKN